MHHRIRCGSVIYSFLLMLVGDIEPWMDESYIYNLFAHTGEVSNVKIIRDKTTNVPAGYGFIYFSSVTVAQKILESYNGQQIPGTNKVFRYFFLF